MQHGTSAVWADEKHIARIQTDIAFLAKDMLHLITLRKPTPCNAKRTTYDTAGAPS